MSKTEDNVGQLEMIKGYFIETFRALYDTLIPVSATAAVKKFPPKYIYASIFIFQGKWNE